MGGQNTASLLTHTHRASSNRLTFLLWGTRLPTARGGPSEAVFWPRPTSSANHNHPQVGAWSWAASQSLSLGFQLELTEPFPPDPRLEGFCLELPQPEGQRPGRSGTVPREGQGRGNVEALVPVGSKPLPVPVSQRSHLLRWKWIFVS